MPAAIPAVIGAAGAVGGALINKKSAKDAAAAQSENGKLDPRIEQMMFGANGQQGLLERYQGMLDAPQSDAMKQYGDMAGSYLTQNGAADMGSIRGAATGLLSGIAAPQAQAAQWSGTPQMSAALTGATPQMSAAQAGPASLATAARAEGAPQVTPHGAEVLWNKGETFNAPQAMQAAQAGAAQVNQPAGMQASLASGVQMNAPKQNSTDLTGSYDSFINGEAGNNPYLTGAIQKGINQSSNAFGNMLTDAKSATMGALGNIRGGAMMAGQFGGSRQGLAEGKAIDSMNTNLSRAASQFGQNNTDAAVAAQAGAYDADRNRALAATQGLGAQQYGAASTNAGLAQQTQLSNQQAQQQASSTNYGGLLSGALANAGYTQQSGLANQASQNNAAQTNYTGQLQTNSQNASNLQQANLANQNAGNSASQFGAAASNAASLANAQIGQSNNQFNAGLAQQTGQFNAGQQNSNNQFNAGLVQSANQYNTGLQQNAGQFNAGQQQNANQFNAGLLQNTGLANLGNQQQTSLANLSAQLGTNQLNSGNAMNGSGLLSGLMGTAYQGAANQDGYALNRAQQVNGLLTSLMSGTPTQNVVASNSGAAALGGGMAGLSLGNSLGNMFGGGKDSAGGSMGNFADLFGGKFMNY